MPPTLESSTNNTPAQLLYATLTINRIPETLGYNLAYFAIGIGLTPITPLDLFKHSGLHIIVLFYPSSYLSVSETNSDQDDYLLGALVLARLDADLRANGNATIYDLFTAVGSGDTSTDYNVSAFHADYERLGGNRSEAELRTLLEQPETIEPAYMTPSARVLPDSLTRHPNYTDSTPRETEKQVFPWLVLLLPLAVEAVLRLWDSVSGCDDE